MLSALVISALVLQFAIAMILVRRDLRTRDIGFIWLGVAVVAWPIMSRLLEVRERISIDRVTHHQPVIYPFSLIEHGQITIGNLVAALALSQQLFGVVLLLIAIVYLIKPKADFKTAS